jgi:hypothetical protein
MMTTGVSPSGSWLLCLLWISAAWLAGQRCFSSSPVSIRAAGSVLALFVLQAALFSVLAVCGLFSLGAALIALSLLVAALGFVGTKAGRWREELARDLSRLRSLPQIFGAKVLTAAFLIACVSAGVRLLRGLAAPPLAWDALTYHLFRAGRWVQLGGWTPAPGPDAWGYYEFFSPTLDSLFAWAMLPAHSDAFLPLLGLVLWACFGAAAAVAARVLGAGREASLWAGLIAATTPAALTALTASYADVTIATVALLGVALLLHGRQRASFETSAWGCLGLFLAASMKPSMLALLFVGLLMLFARRWRPTAAALFPLALTLLLAIPALRIFQLRGSPLYPFSLKLGSLSLLQGNRELAWVLSGAHAASPSAIFVALFWPGLEHEPMSLGPLALPMLLVGLAALAAAGLRRESRSAALFTLLAMAAVVAPLLSPESRSLWNPAWVASSPRFLLVPYALVVAFAARHNAARPLLIAGVLLHAACSLPRTFTPADLRGMAVSAVAIAVLGLAVYVLSRARWLWVALACGLATSVLACRLRESTRYADYAAAAAGERDDLQPLAGRWVVWPLWQALDDGPPRRVALTAGFRAPGHSLFAYPVLGRQLQNRVSYVPVTGDGSIVDLRDAAQLQVSLSPEQWLARLRSEGITDVLAIAPAPPEVAWMSARPDLFELVLEAAPVGWLYRVRPAH